MHRWNVSTKEAAKIYRVSVRRVQQLIKEYKETGEVPVLKKERRPKTYLSSRYTGSLLHRDRHIY